MAKIGYARVSTGSQTLASQLDMLQAAGCAPIFRDHGVSGTKMSRKGFDAALASLVEGDQLVVTKLDRLGRNTIGLLELADELQRNGIGLVSTTQGLDTSTPMGKAMYRMMAVFAELERDLLVERTRAGLAAARARGNVGGRPTKLSRQQVEAALALLGQPGMTRRKVADGLGVGRSTLGRALAAYARATG